jgi:hypothetical protein
MLNGEDDQPGWVRLFRDSVRIYLRERCDIEDCGVPPAVCGAAIPLIRDITATANLTGIELVWDGMTSVLDSLSGCETRRPAGAGNYVARFCFSRRAEFEPGGDPTGSVPGTLVEPTCVEKPFTLGDQQVVLRIPPDKHQRPGTSNPGLGGTEPQQNDTLQRQTSAHGKTD